MNFDFKGRDGLLKKLQEYLPNDHYLVTAVKRATYRSAIEKLAALRNFAAHGSAIIRPLKPLADEIESLPPY